MTRKLHPFLVILFYCTTITTIRAQVNLPAGSTIIQNFDGMATSATAALPSGWKVNTIDNSVGTVGSFASAVTATNQRGGASMSSSAGSGIYNFAAGDPATASDRAVGGLSSGSSAQSMNLFADLLNSGGTTISSYIISYDVEKYRNGSNPAGFSIQLWYSTNGTSWTSAGPNFKTSFAADGDNNGYASVPASTMSVTSKTLTISVSSGVHLYLAWNYSVTSGTTTTNAQALGIDNVAITAVGSTPSASLAAGSLSPFGNICISTTPSPHSFLLVGSNLNGSAITVGPLTGYGFSASAGGPFTSTLSPSYTGSNLNATVYVQFSPASVVSYNGNIPVSGGGASSINVAASGAGVSGASPTVSSGAAGTITSAGAVVAGNIIYGGCSSVTGYGIEYSTVNGFAYGAGTQVASANLSSGVFSSSLSGLSPTTTYYYHAYATNSNGTSYGSQQSFSTSALEVTATAATGRTSAGFTANWNSTAGAADYRFDVSVTSDFMDPTATRLAYWTFPVLSADSLVDTASALNTTQYITVIGTNAATYSTSGATSNAARATSWASGSGTKYWQIRVNTTGFYNLFVSSKQRSSSTGPRDFKIQYKIRAGGAWTDLSVSSVTVGDNFTTGDVTRTLPDICSNQDTVFIRWIMTSNTAVGGGVVAAAGASLIDDILILGRQRNCLAGYDDLTVAGTSQPVTGLSPGSTYYYRVRAFDGSMVGPSSNVITATTLSLEEALQVTALAATDHKTDSFTAHWNAVPGAVHYYLDVSTGSNFVDTDTTRLAQWVFPFSSSDATVDTANAANTSATITAAGGVSSLTFSTSGATSNAARATSWTSGSGTKYWQVIVNTAGFYNLMLSSKQRSSSTGPRDFKIQYKVKAAGTWSDIALPGITVADDFTTGVVNKRSLPAACNNQDSVFIRWIMTSNTAVGGGVVAGAGASLIDDILIAGNEASYLAGYRDSLVNDTFLIVTGLSPNTTYYYRVRASDGTVAGFNSNTIAATTLGEEELLAGRQTVLEKTQEGKRLLQDAPGTIAVYPNPASGAINVKITVPVREKITCLIMNMAGYKVKEVVQNAEAGSNIFTIALPGLSPGVYYLRCIGSLGSTFSQKIIVR